MTMRYFYRNHEKIGKLGLFGIFVPEEYGGSGFGYAEYDGINGAW